MRIIRSVMVTVILVGSWGLIQAQSNTFPSSGNVGIGTTGPTSHLEIFKSGASINLRDTGEQSDWGLIIRQNTDLSGYVGISGRDLNIVTGWDKKLILGHPEYENYGGKVVIPWGNIGIGTSNPLGKFHLQGSGEDAPSDMYLRGGSTSAGSKDIPLANIYFGSSEGGSGSEKAAIIRALADRDFNSNDYPMSMAFFTTTDNSGTAKQRMIIRSNGRIGIGTTTPTAKLSVNGTTKTKEVVVTDQAGDWPDYVFADPEYQLPSLGELETYIYAYKHLPGIPSKDEIEKEGQFLGAIQKELLKKIEELTLYTIDQQKRIEALEEKLKQLQNKK